MAQALGTAFIITTSPAKLQLWSIMNLSGYFEENLVGLGT